MIVNEVQDILHYKEKLSQRISYMTFILQPYIYDFQFRKKKKDLKGNILNLTGVTLGEGSDVAANWWHKTLIGWEKSCMNQSDKMPFTSHMS